MTTHADAHALLTHAFGLARSHTQAAIAAQRRFLRSAPPSARSEAAYAAMAQSRRESDAAFGEALALLREVAVLVRPAGVDEEAAWMWGELAVEGICAG
jgi:hypothetical protein